MYWLIKGVLVESPAFVCVVLILGGLVLLAVDRMPFKPIYRQADALPYHVALKISFMQCLTMLPGVSRSSATIVGGLPLETDKRTVAKFSFFLALPTMTAASIPPDLLCVFLFASGYLGPRDVPRS